jgi:hypothetical protein
MIKKLLLLLLVSISQGTKFFCKRPLHTMPRIEKNVTTEKMKPITKNDMIFFFRIWATMFIFSYPFIGFPFDKDN